MHVFTGIDHLLEDIGFAIMNVMEGFIAVISFIPTMIENLLFSLELFTLGLISCINFIFNSVGYLLIFLVDLPSNVGRVVIMAANGVNVLNSWIVSFLEFVLKGLCLGLESVSALFENGIFYLTNLIRTLIDMIPRPNTNLLMDVLSHADKAIRGLAVSLMGSLKNVVGLPFRMVQNLWFLLKELLNIPFLVIKGLWNFLSQVVTTILSLMFGALNHLWKVLVGFLGKIWTILWPFSADSVYLKVPQDARKAATAAGEILYTGNPGWLTRFSQLMLVFAVIIFIAVLLTILYHMRHKIHTTLITVATMAIDTFQSVFIREHRAVNINDNRGARRLLDVQNDNVEENAGGDDIDVVDRGNEDHRRPVLRNLRVPQDHGESSRRVAERGASPAPPPPNYQKLLQQERDKQLCVVCQDQEKDTLLLPCKHLCVCSGCVDHITNAADLDRRRCPLCRKKITAYVDVFT